MTEKKRAGRRDLRKGEGKESALSPGKRNGGLALYEVQKGKGFPTAPVWKKREGGGLCEKKEREKTTHKNWGDLFFIARGGNEKAFSLKKFHWEKPLLFLAWFGKKKKKKTDAPRKKKRGTGYRAKAPARKGGRGSPRKVKKKNKQELPQIKKSRLIRSSFPKKASKEKKKGQIVKRKRKKITQKLIAHVLP